MTEVAANGVGAAYLEEARRQLVACRDRIMHCLRQLDDRQLWWRPHERMNSVISLTLHVCDSLREWIVAGVGGSPDGRASHQEFAAPGPTARAELLLRLEEVIGEVDTVLAETTDEQLLECRVQGSEQTVLSAVCASLALLHGHTDEIVCLTRLQRESPYLCGGSPSTPEQVALQVQMPEPETIALRDAIFQNGGIVMVNSGQPATEPPLAVLFGTVSRPS